MHDKLLKFFEDEILSDRDLAAILMSPVDYADMRHFLRDELTITDASEWAKGYMAVFRGADIVVCSGQPEGHYGLTHKCGLWHPIIAISPLQEIRLQGQTPKTPS